MIKIITSLFIRLTIICSFVFCDKIDYSIGKFSTISSLRYGVLYFSDFSSMMAVSSFTSSATVAMNEMCAFMVYFDGFFGSQNEFIYGSNNNKNQNYKFTLKNKSLDTKNSLITFDLVIDDSGMNYISQLSSVDSVNMNFNIALQSSSIIFGDYYKTIPKIKNIETNKVYLCSTEELGIKSYSERFIFGIAFRFVENFISKDILNIALGLGMSSDHFEIKDSGNDYLISNRTWRSTKNRESICGLIVSGVKEYKNFNISGSISLFMPLEAKSTIAGTDIQLYVYMNEITDITSTTFDTKIVIGKDLSINEVEQYEVLHEIDVNRYHLPYFNISFNGMYKMKQHIYFGVNAYIDCRFRKIDTKQQGIRNIQLQKYTIDNIAMIGAGIVVAYLT